MNHAELSGPDVGPLFDALPTGIAALDAAGNIANANAWFWTALNMPASKGSFAFETLFGEPAANFTADSRTIALHDRQYSLSVCQIAGAGAVCHLHEVTQWIEDQTRARTASETDTLTGLANRASILRKIDRALETDRAAALMMVDLDHFKQVNDTLGHPTGDALLKKVSERLSASLRATDRLARLGGDEFAILQTDVAQPHGAETLAKRIVELVGRPYVIDGHMIDIGASLGVALSGSAQDTATFMKQADIALYKAKRGGRGRYCFFEQSMDAEVQERRNLEIGLRRALAFRQFELYYQPQMDLTSRAITGMEALLRWNHPERGIVAPATFIPLAEETGLIIPIGEWVIRQACDHAATWPQPLNVAVNVSAKQLVSGKLVNTVASALANAGIPPERFVVEITESVLMTDTAHCVATLHALRDLGVRVSMDDFGTGYSSLSYLQSFPFHTIKIDQSFVRCGDRAKNDGIIRAITAIGHHLGMATIAEGVETEAQLDHMLETGCGSAQGYLISRPVPADEVAALLVRLEDETHETPASSDSDDAKIIPVEEDLFRLVYYSSNTIMGLDEEVRASVDQILAASRRNNALVGVTGALMFTDGLFGQVLEGRREVVEAVFERIQLDERHGEVQLLSFAPIEARAFPEWAMAYVGASELGVSRFGHYASTSGFDVAAADGNAMTAHLHALLIDEERLMLRAA